MMMKLTKGLVRVKSKISSLVAIRITITKHMSAMFVKRHRAEPLSALTV